MGAFYVRLTSSKKWKLQGRIQTFLFLGGGRARGHKKPKAPKLISKGARIEEGPPVIIDAEIVQHEKSSQKWHLVPVTPKFTGYNLKL